MIPTVIGVCCIVLGLIGMLLEVVSYAQTGAIDGFGVALASLLAVVGVGFCFWSRVLALVRTSIPGQRKLLIVAGILELAVVVPVAVFVVVLGYQGFAAGEMGAMIGILALAFLVVLLPFAGVRILVVYGLWHWRRWAVVLSLVFGGLYLVGGVLSVFVLHGYSLLLFGYGGVTLWAGAGCLQDPGFARAP